MDLLPLDAGSFLTLSSSGFSRLPPPTHMNDEETVGSILRSRRKRRAIRACFPCRHRRVRCDGESPCSSCVQRGHAELCQRQAAAVASNLSNASSSPGSTGGLLAGGAQATQSSALSGQGVTAAAGDLHLDSSLSSGRRSLLLDGAIGGGGVGIGATTDDPLTVLQRLERIEEHIAGIKADLRRQVEDDNGQTATVDSSKGTPMSEAASLAPPPKPPGRHFVEHNTGATIFLGSHADPPAALGLLSLSLFDPFCRSKQDCAVATEPAPRTYAFTNLWGPDVGITEVCNTLPADRDLVR